MDENITSTISPELKEVIVRKAKEMDRSIAYVVRKALENYYAHELVNTNDNPNTDQENNSNV